MISCPASGCLRPLTTALMVATRSDPAVDAVPENASDEERAVAFAKALARRAVLAWEGIGDGDGKPIDPSPEAIDAALDVWPLFEAFQLTYVSKGLLLEQEKNASALSPTGPSAGASATAEPAGRRATVLSQCDWGEPVGFEVGCDVMIHQFDDSWSEYISITCIKQTVQLEP